MKKSIIAAGAASVALAAMPIVGVFAAPASYTAVDNITATVSNGCTITRTGGDLTYAKAISVVAGSFVTDQASDATTVTCNANGWTLSATATGTEGYEDKLYFSSTPASSIAAGTATSGDTSNWAYKVNYTVPTSGTETTGSYAAASTTPATIIAASATAEATTGTFTPYYQVFAKTTQASGSYTGQMTYTITAAAE